MMTGGGMTVGVMVVRFIIVGHISVHFVMGMMMVWVMKQLKEWIESKKLQKILVIRLEVMQIITCFNRIFSVAKATLQPQMSVCPSV